MNKISLILSSAGLKNLTQIKSETEFLFILGKHEFKLNSVIAEFLSPFVSHMHQSDPTINSFNFQYYFKNISNSNLEDYNQIFTEDIINLFKQLSNGLSIELNENQIYKMQLLAIVIGNDELFEKIDQLFPINQKEPNFDKLIQQLQIFHIFPQHFKRFNRSNIIDHIASHFTSIDPKKLINIPKSILYEIISSEFLKVDSQDSLIDFINEIFKNNEKSDKIYFYEKVEFDKLSEEKFQLFLEEFDYTEMTNQLWQKLCSCFNHQKTTIKKGTAKEIQYDGNASNRFKGIIHYLSEKCGGNVSEKGVVNVTASTSNESAKKVVDFEDTSKYYQSAWMSDQWIKYDFNEMRIKPTQYSIRTRNNDDSANPQGWVIEGSNTGRDDDWKIIDSRKGVTSLQKRNQVDTFEIKNDLKESYRYLRLRLTEMATSNCPHLTLSALEYFGFLIEKESL